VEVTVHKGRCRQPATGIDLPRCLSFDARTDFNNDAFVDGDVHISTTVGQIGIFDQEVYHGFLNYLFGDFRDIPLLIHNILKKEMPKIVEFYLF
jgi:hypothetical protein